MSFSRTFPSSQRPRLRRASATSVLALAILIIFASCKKLPPSFRVSEVNGGVRAAVVRFDQGWRMPKGCVVSGYCEPAIFRSDDDHKLVVTLECMCEDGGEKLRYGVLVENSYLIDKTTLLVRPGGEDRRIKEFQLPRGSDAISLAQYAQRDGDWRIARGTRFRYPGKFGQSPGLIQSDSGQRFASLSYDAFGRETYGLVPDPSHLLGYAHKGTFYIASYDVDHKQEIGVVELPYQGLPPDSFRPDFYGDGLLFNLLLGDRYGIVITWDDK